MFIKLTSWRGLFKGLALVAAVAVYDVASIAPLTGSVKTLTKSRVRDDAGGNRFPTWRHFLDDVVSFSSSKMLISCRLVSRVYSPPL